MDTNALLDLLASLEGGFSFVEKVTTRSVTTSATDRSAKAEGGTEFGIPNVLSLLKINLGGSLTSKKGQETGSERQAERYHTYGSLLYRFRASLMEQNMIMRFDGSDQSWDAIQPSSFVELRGVFRPNPFADYLRAFDRLIRLIPLFSSIQNNTLAGSGKARSKSNMQSDDMKQIKQVGEIIQGILTDLENGDIKLFVIDLIESLGHKAVISLFTEYLRDRTLNEIRQKEFRLFGKVVRKVSSSDGDPIDLLQGTTLGSFGESALSQLAESFNQIQGMNLPKVESRIAGPALQVVPLAIYV